METRRTQRVKDQELRTDCQQQEAQAHGRVRSSPTGLISRLQPRPGLGRAGVMGLQPEDAPADGGRGADLGQLAAEVGQRRRDDGAVGRAARPGPVARCRLAPAGVGVGGRRRRYSRSSNRRRGWPGRGSRPGPVSREGGRRHRRRRRPGLPSRSARARNACRGSTASRSASGRGRARRVRQRAAATLAPGCSAASGGRDDDDPRTPSGSPTTAWRRASPNPASTGPRWPAASRPRAEGRRAIRPPPMPRRAVGSPEPGTGPRTHLRLTQSAPAPPGPWARRPASRRRDSPTNPPGPVERATRCVPA